MKRILTLAALIWAATAAAKGPKGELTGSFETNTIYYTDDAKSKAVRPSYDEGHKVRVGSNNYLKLDYRKGRFSAGAQLEYYPHPLQAMPAENAEYLMEGFGIGNLTGKYVSWTDRNYSATIGDLYDQFGSGLVFRSWEDRALGFNNSLGGARVTYNYKDILGVKALYGFPRFYRQYLATQVGGLDVSFSLSNALGWSEHSLSLEGSAVNRYQKQLPSTMYELDVATGQVDRNKKLPDMQPNNVLGYSARAAWDWRGLMARVEYVGKGKELTSHGVKQGEAWLLEAGYTGDGFGLTGQYRELSYMQSRAEYMEDGIVKDQLAGNTINYLPSLSIQHSYMLASLEPNQVQFVDFDNKGERGAQIDGFYLFKRGSAIGGRRGMKVHANYAASFGLRADDGKSGKQLYRDFTFDIDKSWNSKLRTILFVSLQKNATHNTEYNVFVADVTYKFTQTFSLRGELQYNYASKGQDGDWVAGLLEASFAPKWSVFASDMYNNGNSISKVHYYNAGFSFTHSFIRLSASWGRNREGLVCSGGVCRLMPAYTGGNLAMTLTF